MPLLTPPHRLIATPLALPLPSAVPAPLPFSSRPGAQSRIHVGGKRLRAYPCDLFLEPVFAKKTPAASSCALMWTPRPPPTQCWHGSTRVVQALRKKRPPVRGHASHALSNIELGGAGALELFPLRLRRGRFFRKHRNAFSLVLNFGMGVCVCCSKPFLVTASADSRLQ